MDRGLPVRLRARMHACQDLADLLGRPLLYVAKYENGARNLDVIEAMAIAAVIKADHHANINAMS